LIAAFVWARNAYISPAQNNEVRFPMTAIGGVSVQQLRSFIERVERLEDEKTELAEQIREVLGEAKGEGFDTKTMRQIIRMRRMKREELAEQEALLDLYRQALGMSDLNNNDEDSA
jgi:uncharacterized protein (UPF0335 family)